MMPMKGNINLSWMNQSPMCYTLSQVSEDDRRPTIKKKEGKPGMNEATGLGFECLGPG